MAKLFVRAYDVLDAVVVEVWTYSERDVDSPPQPISIFASIEPTELAPLSLPELGQRLARAIEEWAWHEQGI